LPQESSFSINQLVVRYTIEAYENPMKAAAMEHVVDELKRKRNASANSVTPDRSEHSEEKTKQSLSGAIMLFAVARKGDILADAVFRKLERDKFPFTAKEKQKSVRDALQKLCKEGKLVRVRQGSAGKPNVYRLAPQKHD
jgi:hypothetical protein